MFEKLKNKIKDWASKSEEKAGKGEETVENEKESKEEGKEGEGKDSKSGWQKLKSKFKFQIDEDYFENIFEDLELILLENNVALEAIDKIRKELKEQLIGKEIKKKEVEKEVKNALKKSIRDLLKDPFDLIKKIEQKEEPYIIAFFGVNGSGKTTTIAKLAKKLKDKKLEPVMAACDTFRAASIEQLEKHAQKIGVKIISGEYGSDPASIAYDAIKHARSKNKKVVLIDTAGRMHNNKGLMEEMKKIMRVNKPDLNIFVAEAITGNDAIEQARSFDESVGIDCSILTKSDIDDKGGTAIYISYVTGKPILYLGTGQEYKDLKKFNPSKLLEELDLS